MGWTEPSRFRCERCGRFASRITSPGAWEYMESFGKDVCEACFARGNAEAEAAKEDRECR